MLFGTQKVTKRDKRLKEKITGKISIREKIGIHSQKISYKKKQVSLEMPPGRRG